MKTFKKILRYIIPPIFIIIFKKLKKKEVLFDGRDASLFLDNALRSKIYGEYGVGYSTLKVRNESDAIIIAVDTNIQYLNDWKTKIKARDNDVFLHQYIGEIAGLGYPSDYSRRELFIRYFESIWNFESKPDFVLIDGRFRVACFLTSLLLAEPGAKILFDDYDRRYYRVVEEVIHPLSTTLTQALFIVPTSLDKEKIIELRDSFSMVML